MFGTGGFGSVTSRSYFVPIIIPVGMIRLMNRPVLVGLLVGIVVSAVIVTLYATGSIAMIIGGPKTNSKTTFSSANVSSANHLFMNSTEPVIQSVTVQGCDLSTVTLSKVSFPSTWFEVTVNATENCAVVVNTDYSSEYIVTVSGLSNFVSRDLGSVQLTIYTSFRVSNIRLSIDSYTFNSSTNVTLDIRNNGTVNAMLSSYNVTDTAGNTWTSTSWAGPTVVSNGVVSTNILIGSSCQSCTYAGSTNAFNGFSPGNSYTIEVVTSTGQPSKFTVVR